MGDLEEAAVIGEEAQQQVGDIATRHEAMRTNLDAGTEHVEEAQVNAEEVEEALNEIDGEQKRLWNS